MARKDTPEDVDARLNRSKPAPEWMDPTDGLSTGSTLLNLEMSGTPYVGFFPKRIYRFIGKSGSGKTWLTLNAFAEAVRSKRYAKHRLIHDNPEDGAQMDFKYYFGPEVANRVEPPGWRGKKASNSRTIEEFCGRMNDLCKKGDPFIGILDSVDALTAVDEQTYRKKLYAALRNEKKDKAGEDGEDKLPANYGTAKAKALSSGFNELSANIHDSDSIIIVIQHAKVNIGRDSFFRPLTVSGGLSPGYYSDVTIWTAVAGGITQKQGGKNHKVGITVAMKIDKNRHTGHEDRLVEIDILNRYGLDDISSCVDYLIDTGHWVKEKGWITAQEISDEPVKRSTLIEMVETADLEPELKQIVAMKWQEVEDALTPQRKPRYRSE